MMPKKILIADDQVATTEALAKFARMRGYDVVSVTNGVDLLTIVAKQKFDIVITDLIMPDLNGVSAAEIMKLQGSTIPVIALTGLAPQDIEHIQDSFTRIYHKPVNASELFNYLDSLLQ